MRRETDGALTLIIASVGACVAVGSVLAIVALDVLFLEHERSTLMLISRMMIVAITLGLSVSIGAIVLGFVGVVMDDRRRSRE